MNDYHFKYKKLKRRVNLLKAKIEDLNEYVKLDACIDRETMVNLIQEIVSLIIDKKKPKDVVYKGFFYLSKSSKNSDSIEIIEIREQKAIPHKQWKKIRPRKVK